MTDHCPLCQQLHHPQILAYGASLQSQLVDLLRQLLPTWRPEDGLCPDCALQLQRTLSAQRHSHSLHTTTDPHTTFPYYHPAEETVLGQAERLPDYFTFPAQGVTVAFLDSGYFPHPDLGGSDLGDAGRLIEYIDLTDGGERMGLEQLSLWDGAGDSWHGQMTSVIACGDGNLSGGRYRGLAPAASILPIKIGRGGGRIPEDDILTGLSWLLQDDNWARYNVRVVNISVGGDFVQPWEQNPVCLAAEALSARGVFVAAAAGNSGRNVLLAPAQAPSVLTVGGYDDHNHGWSPAWDEDVRRLALYHHNWANTKVRNEWIAKPELLALGRYVPGPILPVSPVWHEMEMIAELRSVLGLDEGKQRRPRLPHSELDHVERALRRAMNAHKWIHRHYQHVDGTSVAVAQVSAVAAQMLQANPALTPLQVREILTQSALPLPATISGHSGHGILQPAAAVATALRTDQGQLSPFWRSASELKTSELQKWHNLGKVEGPSAASRQFYVGVLAPTARSVSLLAPINGWMPGRTALLPTERGWWHTVISLPERTTMPYRFWVEDGRQPEGGWMADPENSLRMESGFETHHSVLGL